MLSIAEPRTREASNYKAVDFRVDSPSYSISLLTAYQYAYRDVIEGAVFLTNRETRAERTLGPQVRSSL